MLHFTNKQNSQNSKYQQKYANWKTIYCRIPYETFYYQELQVNKKNCLTIRWGNWCVIIEEYIAMIGPITLMSYTNTNKLWWNDVFYGKYVISIKKSSFISVALITIKWLEFIIYYLDFKLW
jgi:Na+-transporting NADH:ubiquinone oxidoreductase subunit NqrB